jgi:hypothetical protein
MMEDFLYGPMQSVTVILQWPDGESEMVLPILICDRDLESLKQTLREIAAMYVRSYADAVEHKQAGSDGATGEQAVEREHGKSSDRVKALLLPKTRAMVERQVALTAAVRSRRPAKRKAV